MNRQRVKPYPAPPPPMPVEFADREPAQPDVADDPDVDLSAAAWGIIATALALACIVVGIVLAPYAPEWLR
jgi:hypothetical protein